VSAIAENSIQLPEVPIVKEPSLKGSHCLNVDFSVNSIGFLYGVVKVVFVFRQFVLAESDILGLGRQCLEMLASLTWSKISKRC